ncbi:hypothetical protein K3G63_15770 [Hymenobacter sp. HSC-4F20]|uniref:toxin-antitoxin system YwqK family antitoxin n=1 Tax=Hymenobacter sp. HSC-4F20 TaxID=2864135 RepID=UPI001C73D917|nr:hypothetical protein [Hymenobacter sp. HSC-4F20]MBX0291911.1 hypothetical protein [Hymenobacter sp. HSC-4F20]
MFFRNRIASTPRPDWAIEWLLLASTLVLTSCATARRGPVGFWSHNRYDGGGEQRHGPWREYFDAQEQRLANRGRYQHGLPVGRWHTYTPTGQLERTERFYRHPYGLVRLTYYHPNGQVAKRGRARYRAEPTGAHFFWFGEWQRFAPDGQPLPSEWYLDGRQTAPPSQ